MSNKRQSAANIALQGYLDDLSASEPLISCASKSASESSVSKPSASRPSVSGASISKETSLKTQSDEHQQIISQKVMNAQRLLNKANPIEAVLDLALASGAVKDERLEIKESSVANQNKEKSDNADIISSEEIRSKDLSLKESLPANFQALLCEVSGVTIALPLIELGGIHKIDKLSMNAKKPSWFKGVLIKGDLQFNCIDAATWLVPQKYSNVNAAIDNNGKVGASNVQESDYQFAVQLGKSEYALCCHSINNTIELTSNDVKWRSNSQKHPWLAGLLKEKMCALIDGAKMVQEVLT